MLADPALVAAENLAGDSRGSPGPSLTCPGGSIYELSGFSAEIEGGPMVPRSVLNALRRDLIAKLDAGSTEKTRAIADAPVLPNLRPPLSVPTCVEGGLHLSVLCRTTGQIEAAVAVGIKTIYAEFQDIKGYKEAVAAARAVDGTEIFLATPRIQKPGEANIFRYLARQGADGIHVRNAGGLYFVLPSKPSRSWPISP